MNTTVTFPQVSSMTIPSLVMRYQPWRKKIPAELGKVAQKRDLIKKLVIFKANLSPENDVFVSK